LHKGPIIFSLFTDSSQKIFVVWLTVEINFLTVQALMFNDPCVIFNFLK
jgi:hypothetical protein